MIPTLLNGRNPIHATGDLPGLQAVLIQQLVGEPFLFACLSYGDELVLHFGIPREYTLPRFGMQTEGSHILSVRGSAWLLKSGTKPLAAWAGPLPEGSPEPTGQPLDKESLEAGVLIEKDACIATAGPFLLAGVDAYGLQVLLSDGVSSTARPLSLTGTP